MRHSDFCIFILSHGRADNVITHKTLRRKKCTAPIFIVIDNEDDQEWRYRQNFGDQVVVFDKADVASRFEEADNFNDRRSIFYARNACFEIAERLGYKYFMELDDDYTDFSFCFDDEARFQRKTVKNIDSMLDVLLDFYKSAERIDTLAIAQGGDLIGGKQNAKISTIQMTRKAMNSFICCVDRPFQFVGRVNEDVNTYTHEGSIGKVFLTTFLYQLNQMQTQANTGGMTELYVDSGTYVKSFYTVMFMPGSTTIALMGNKNKRLHHNIDWEHTVPKILRPDDATERGRILRTQDEQDELE